MTLTQSDQEFIFWILIILAGIGLNFWFWYDCIKNAGIDPRDEQDEERNIWRK